MRKVSQGNGARKRTKPVLAIASKSQRIGIGDISGVLVQIGGTDMRVPDAPYNIQARSTAFQTAGAVRR
jgi:hypothetical protein